jgi:hypothetical protein
MTLACTDQHPPHLLNFALTHCLGGAGLRHVVSPAVRLIAFDDGLVFLFGLEFRRTSRLARLLRRSFLAYDRGQYHVIAAVGEAWLTVFSQANLRIEVDALRGPAQLAKSSRAS